MPKNKLRYGRPASREWTRASERAGRFCGSKGKIRFLSTTDYGMNRWFLVAAEDVAQDLISYICPKASRIAFFPRHGSSRQILIQAMFVSPVNCQFCTLPTDAATFKTLQGSLYDGISPRSCPKGRGESFTSDHCSYSSSDRTPALTSSFSRPRPPRVAGLDYYTLSNPSSWLRSIVGFSSFCG